MQTSDLANSPFQFWIFLTVSIANLLVNVCGIIGGSIFYFVKLLAKESAPINQRIQSPQNQEHREAQNQQIQDNREVQIQQQALDGMLAIAVDAELRDLIQRNPFGKVVGFLEIELYLYAMIANVPGIISAVLLFKAFSGWLSISSEPTNGTREFISMLNLARFYSYAIGNFVSLIWALLIFEILRSIMYFNPAIKALLTIS